MSKEKEIRGYCAYCKEIIYYDKACTTDSNGKIYHPDCYSQSQNYADDFGTYNYDEFGEARED